MVDSIMYTIINNSLYSINLYLYITDRDFLESITAYMTMGSLGSVTDVGHLELSLKTTTDSVVNTLWFTPANL